MIEGALDKVGMRVLGKLSFESRKQDIWWRFIYANAFLQYKSWV